MLRHLKSCLVIASLLLMAVPLSSGETSHNNSSDLLTSQSSDGFWVNDTLTIDGSTTLNPQNMDWVLYDVTEPYIEWPILDSGDFFTTVTPIDEGLWTWSLVVDVSNLNCTCWLKIGQPNGLDKEFLNRIIFIGEGPHDPVISPLHSLSFMLDEPIVLSAKAILSDSNASEGSILLNWCNSPNGACDGDVSSTNLDVIWQGNVATFTINATELGLTDGVWSFNYSYQDALLKVSPEVTMTVYVDRNPPISSLISPNESLEGEEIIIDGSGSNDGVWSNNLQYVWYITKPDGTVYAPNTNNSENVLSISLNDSGTHTIRLDVIDWVGRMNTSSESIIVSNTQPEIEFRIDGIDVTNPKSWQFNKGENISLQPLVFDPGDLDEKLTYNWFVNDELVSNAKEFSIQDLDEGTHELRLTVVDDDGANDTYNIEIIIKSENSDNEVGNYGAIFVLIGIVLLSVIMIKRMKTGDSDTKTLPKWNQNSNKEVAESENSEDGENQLWD